MRYAVMVVLAGMLALSAGCEPDPQAVELDRRLVNVYGNSAVENAIVRQHTVFPYHFEYGGADLNALGKKDLGTSEFPAIETTLIDGDVAFRQHSGGHTPGPNWPTFLRFAERYLR